MRLALVACLVACSTSTPPAPPPPAPAPVSAKPAAPPDAAVPAATARFWSWLVANADRLGKADLVKATNEIQKQLEPVAPGVIAEIGAGTHERTLVLSADGLLA